MADIFVSYKKEDAGRVVRIVEGLREAGFSVWWDHGIAPGSQWDQTIQKELNEAKMVVAVWSELSISAPWVKEEAGVGKARGKLLPVRIDDVEPPLGFGLIQMAGLIDWDGDQDDPRWEHFLAAVKATLSGEPVEGLERPVKRKSQFVKMLPILALFALLAGAGAFVLMKLDSIMGVSVDYNDGTSSEYARGGNAKPTEAETKLFDKAKASMLKTDYQDYLRAYPQGFYSKKIREEILTLCKGEMRPTTERIQPFGQWQRAISDFEAPDGTKITWSNPEDACENAKRNFKTQVDSQCRAIASASKGSEVELNIEWADCECKDVQGNWWCQNDSTYSCSYEFEKEIYVEICG